MTDQSIDTLMTKTAAFAEQLLREQGKVPPRLVIFLGDAMIPVVTNWQDNSDVDDTLDVLREFIAAYWPQGVTFIGHPATPEVPHLPPTQCADAREGVIVAVATPEVERGALYDIVRDADNAPERLVKHDPPHGDLGPIGQSLSHNAAFAGGAGQAPPHRLGVLRR
jgi:hypothetical protein